MLHPLPTLAGMSIQASASSRPIHQHTAFPMKAELCSRVLIVDDHSLFRRVVRDVLDEHPQLAVVGEAANGTGALSLALELVPDIVVLDMNLPDIDGITVTRQLVQALPQTRVVILTIAANDDLIVAAVRAGAFGFLTKDIEPDALVRAIAGVIDGQIAMSRQTAARALFHFQRASHAEASPVASLTDREIEVMDLLAEGATDRQIADRLVIAESTAKKHVQHILRKLQARNRAEAVAKYRQDRARLR
ncbi:MAG TPA: response regulator transcription factor [Herpetosiphonaceae bacterium]